MGPRAVPSSWSARPMSTTRSRRPWRRPPRTSPGNPRGAVEPGPPCYAGSPGGSPPPGCSAGLARPAYSALPADFTIRPLPRPYGIEGSTCKQPPTLQTRRRCAGAGATLARTPAAKASPADGAAAPAGAPKHLREAPRRRLAAATATARRRPDQRRCPPSRRTDRFGAGALSHDGHQADDRPRVRARAARLPNGRRADPHQRRRLAPAPNGITRAAGALTSRRIARDRPRSADPPIRDRPYRRPGRPGLRPRPVPLEPFVADAGEAHALAIAVRVERRRAQLDPLVVPGAGEVKPRSGAVHPRLHPAPGGGVIDREARADQPVPLGVEGLAQHAPAADPLDHVAAVAALPRAPPGADPEIEIARAVHAR